MIDGFDLVREAAIEYTDRTTADFTSVGDTAFNNVIDESDMYGVEMALQLVNAADGHPLDFTPRRIVLAGYTGRDRELVQRHIDEGGCPFTETSPIAPLYHPVGVPA